MVTAQCNYDITMVIREASAVAKTELLDKSDVLEKFHHRSSPTNPPIARNAQRTYTQTEQAKARTAYRATKVLERVREDLLAQNVRNLVHGNL